MALFVVFDLYLKQKGLIMYGFMNCKIENEGLDFWQIVTNGPRKLSDYLLQVTQKFYACHCWP